MNASTRAPLSELFLGIATLLSRKKLPVAIATLSFAMLIAVGSAAVQFQVVRIEDGMMSEFRVDREKLRTTVDADLVAIGEMDVGEFIEASGIRFGSGNVASVPSGEHAFGLAYVRRVSPLVAAQMAFNLIVLFVAAVFFFLLFTGGSQSAYEAARRLPRMTLRMCALAVWLVVRSLLWIPLVGPFIALYMLPRLSLAPVFFAGGEAGVFQSIHLSLKRTSGRWLMTVIRLILIVVTALLILWPMLVLVVGVALLSVKVGYILLLLAFIFWIAYQCAALTVLAAQY